VLKLTAGRHAMPAAPRRPELFLIEDKKFGGKEEDAFHFIAYVPFEGRLYELDGLQKGPIDLGA
jgi:ubiquitin carboxyl-terminal hydrolase L5